MLPRRELPRVIVLLVIFIGATLFLMETRSKFPKSVTSFTLSPGAGSEYAHQYNLLDDDFNMKANRPSDASACTIEYMNANKLPQDHPCVIEIIRRHYLTPPASHTIPYNISDQRADTSSGQSTPILQLLKNKTEGFFIECGALDGVYASNTLYMERTLNWNGILIEANPHYFPRLLSRNRKAWAMSACLSIEPYPTQVVFQAGINEQKYTHTRGHIDAAGTNMINWQAPEDVDMVTVQCFPLYSILLALGRTTVDFFSLDVEGHDLRVLKTIPWHRVNIKTLTVEWVSIPEGEEGLVQFMEANGYVNVTRIVRPDTWDSIFALSKVFYEPKGQWD